MAADVTVYDKAQWHYGGDEYPEDLADSHAFTHGGFLLAWLLENSLLSESFLNQNAEAVKDFASGGITPGEFAMRTGGILSSDMLTTRGDNFAEDYIDEFYLEDYELLFEDDCDHIYKVTDNKQNCKRVFELLTEAYTEWSEEVSAG